MALTAESPGFALRNFTESDGSLFLFQPLHVNAALQQFLETAADFLLSLLDEV